ncbi:MAG: hypothetical protein WDN28_10835 [Chthoniobacter sp.]
MSVVIQIRDHQTAFSPGDRVAGEVSWQLGAPPKSAEVRLLWSTGGRGLEDISVVQTIPFSNPLAMEVRPFTVTLPDAPYSFTGTLIKLTWALVLVVEPGTLTASVDIVVAPGGQAVSLPRVNPA